MNRHLAGLQEIEKTLEMLALEDPSHPIVQQEAALRSRIAEARQSYQSLLETIRTEALP